jgi:nucleoside-triphosphatase THEP1
MSLCIILYGDIDAGKTTVVNRMAALLNGIRVAALRSGALLDEQGHKQRLFLEWSGVERVVFAEVKDPTTRGPERWRVLSNALDEAAGRMARLADGAELVLLDELGAVEQGHAGYVAAVQQLFEQDVPIVAVVQRRALGFWLDAIGEQRIDHMFTVVDGCREDLPGRLAHLYRISR